MAEEHLDDPSGEPPGFGRQRIVIIMRRLSLTDAGIKGVLRELPSQGYLLLTDVEDDAQLLSLAGSLGEVIEPGVGMQVGAHDGRIYSVAARPEGVEQRDQHGNLILSTTTAEFALHTDGYNRPEPPRYVLLMRADRTVDRTASFVSDVIAAADDLPPEIAEALGERLFPSAGGLVALRDRPNGTERLRFNRHEIDNWRQGRLSERAEGAIVALDVALSQRTETFTIAPGQCLLLDNWRVCHGRSALAAGSQRVLRRVWVA